MKFKLLEDVGKNFSRAELIQAIKDYGGKYKYYNFDKYNDQVLYRMLNRIANEHQKAAEDTVKNVYDKQNEYKVTENNGTYEVYDGNTLIGVFTSIDDLNDAGYGNLLNESKKHKKQHAMGYFTKFNRDPEKSMEIFNHNMGADKDIAVSDSTSDSSADSTDSSSGMTASGGE